MKIKRLEMKAFGPFSDRTIEFDAAGPGLHIIFGPNEAGKSSSLRALKALLYGFPERTSDNFLHANNQLLVGGTLAGANGRELTFFRRKKRKADLLDSAGNPLEPGRLAFFLQGLEPPLFASLYGIDHKTLVAGGEDLLAQKGEAGQALFAAGTGIASLKKILDTLTEEADELFKERGSRQQINQAIKEYQELKKTLKGASLSPGQWQEHHQRRERAEADHTRLAQESREKSIEAHRLERLNRVIPELAELENLEKQLVELGEVVVLPPEFAAELRQVEQHLRETGLKIRSCTERRRKLETKESETSEQPAILERAETIEDLHQRLGEYRKGLQDRGRLEGMRITCRRDAGALIETIRPDLTLDRAESLRPVLSKKRTIQALSSRHEALLQQAAQARRQKEAAEHELQTVAECLSRQAPTPDGEGLAKAIQLARRAGDIDTRIETLAREIESEKKNAAADLKRLGLWPGTLEQLPELPLPLLETVRLFEARAAALAQEKERLQREQDKTTAELHAAQTANREVLYGGDIPSEDDLDNSRRKRLQGWQLLLRRWLMNEDVSAEENAYAPEEALHKAYEKHVKQADLIADRLRREAERVAKAASLRARSETLAETSRELMRKLEALHVEEETFADKWRHTWAATCIRPLSPQEMLAWLTNIDKLRFKLGNLSAREQELADRDKNRQLARRALLAELKKTDTEHSFPEVELAPLLLFAETLLENVARRHSEREKLTEKQAQAVTALTKARKTLEETLADELAWQESWDKTLAGLELKERILPSQALDLLETISSCLDKLDKARELQSRINGIDRDAEKFKNEVMAQSKELAPDLLTSAAEAAALQLHSRLTRARQNHELQKKNREEMAALTAEIEIAEKTLASQHQQLAGLLATAGCEKSEELNEALKKSAEYQRLHEKISGARASLAKVSEGLAIEELKLQAENVNVDELPEQIAALKRQIEFDLYPQITKTLKLIGEEDKELQLMNGSGQAAAIADKMEQVAARIKRLVDHYTRLKLAAAVLQKEIERYRKEHQEPILKIASRFFAELTLNSFAGLRTDLDDDGNLVLIGFRSDESRVAVSGMSEGTCDQLYLALRLATLQARLENSEPMPFIVDDILINFDDERSRATLQILAQLAEKNQVILFTHHRKIVEAAQELKAPEVVKIHHL
ncbi:MAG: AAA family ATPase [Deltaproteobacteria bacterium]|nr:AAA family ATPase [Deltaproteobacteria bacterium]